MAEKKITRKVIPASNKEVLKVEKVSQAEEISKISEVRTPDFVGTKAGEAVKIEEGIRPKRTCFFCQSNTKPSYTDINTLHRFVNDRAKIVLRTKSNLCSKHQRLMTKQVKYARHLSLLPFIPKV